MSNLSDRISKLSPARVALLALELQDKLDAVERRSREPIAVVGIGCRLPGARGADEFWTLLRDGVDAVRVVPRERFDVEEVYTPDAGVPGRSIARWGGFVDDVDRFDAALFGIAPREAVSLDPQQRLLLETAWEALEHAGQAPDRLHDSSTGVFVGIGSSDYSHLLSRAGDLTSVDAYRATGAVSHSPASGRIAYALGLQGPAISIDTACSSSLVAVHLACQALRLDECRMALAGGVNVILMPDLYVGLSQAGMLARDGRCKTFDAAADGFVRGEGCGVVVLKRLSDARADGDRILALVRGTAVNQDGRSNGLTAPNGPAQEAVIREALSRAGVSAGDIGYVEAHGTGTELGDPIELHAIGAVLCGERTSADPLRVGSVKTNIGHLEATAGVASFIKLVLSLQRRTIPPHLHFSTPNPHIDWDRYPLRVTTSACEWEPRNGRRIGGVSSFGFSGTNAHAIVEEAPSVDAPAAAGDRPAHVLTLAAMSAAAVADMASRYAAHLAAKSDEALGDVAFTTHVGRAQLPHRIAVVAGTLDEARMRLEAVAAGEAAPGVVSGEARGSTRPRLTWRFAGLSARDSRMGRELYAAAPVFRAALERCAAALRGELAVPLVEVLYGESTEREHETAYAEPALFAVEFALAELWRSWGVEPAAVLGDGVGEYAAACVAGGLPLEEAVRLVAAQARLTGERPRPEVPRAFAAAAAQDVCIDIGPQEMEWSRLLETLGALWVRGVPVDWAAFDAPYARRKIALPTYPFQRQRFWIDTAMPPLPAAAPAVTSPAEAPARHEPALYQVEWERKALSGRLDAGTDAAALPDAATAVPPLGSIAADLQVANGLRVYAESQPRLDRLCSAYVLAALRRMGWQPTVGARFLAAELIERLGIVGPHRRLAARLLDMLREDAILRRTGSVWQVAAVPDEDANRLRESLDREYPSLRIELGMLRRCGEALADVLGGVLDPLQLLFPSGSAADLEALYSRSPAARAYNGLVAETVAREVEARAPRRVRVLEIGAGTGATTAAVTARLGDDRCEYVFTDISPTLTARARQTFAGAAFLRTQVLDIERDPASQGFAGERFDVVIAANVLHATRDLARTVQHAAQLLVPGGLLVLWETARAERWIDLVFGLTDGWWRFADPAVRPDYPLISAGQWSALLRQHGFGDAVCSDEDSARALSPNTLIAARRQPDGGRGAERARRSAVDAASAGCARGHWLVLADREGLGLALAERLEAQGLRCWVAQASDELDLRAPRAARVRPGRRSDLDALIGAIGTLEGVVNLWPLDTNDLAGEAEMATVHVDAGLTLLDVAQALRDSPQAASARLWLVTRGAQATGNRESARPAQAPFWGWGRVLRLEDPSHWGGLVDLDESSDADEADRLLREILESDGEDQVALRSADRFVPRLASLTLPRARPIHLRRDALYVITGGLGVLGLKTAEWMAERGARHLALIGRRGITTGQEAGRDDARAAALAHLRRGGVDVRVVTADVADAPALAGALDSLRALGLPLRGVVHTAGVSVNRAAHLLEAGDVRAAMRPKIEGAWQLHRLTRTDPLDFFVLFSSAAAIWGSKGSSAYAAANQFLDALAHFRRSIGLPALAVNWARWDVGMVTPDAHRWFDEIGLRAFSARDGIRALETLMGSDATQAVVGSVDWARFSTLFAAIAGEKFFERVVERHAPHDLTPVPVEVTGPAASFEDLVRREIATAVGVRLSEVPPDEPLHNLGLDSIMALRARDAIHRATGSLVPIASFLNGCSIRELVANVARQAPAGVPQAAPTPGRPTPARAGSAAHEPASVNVSELSDDEVDAMLRQFLPREQAHD